MKKWKTKSGYEIIQVLDGRCNAFIISYQKKFILVDTGRGNRWDSLRNRIEEIGCKSGVFAALILTHTHFDHAENAARIKSKYHVPIIVNKREEAYLKCGDSPVIHGTIPITKLATDLLAKKLQPFIKYDHVKPDILVDANYGLDTIGLKDVYILHTPGHTMGSQSIIIDDEIAIVGDAMFGIFKWSVFPPFADDKELLIRSWKKLLDTNCRIFIPAHGTENSRNLLKKQYNKYNGGLRVCCQER